jgi:hypothetical protein
MAGNGPRHYRMATLVYKMTHKGDPDSDLGCWGVGDCMGQVRGFTFDAVIGFGGRSWWTNQTSRAGEIVWIGIGPQRTPVRRKRGPEVRFAHFRYFEEGELTLGEIAPKLDKAMHKRRFRLHGFSQAEQREIERILKLANNAGPSASLSKQTAQGQSNGKECRQKVCRRRKPRCNSLPRSTRGASRTLFKEDLVH